ncbi:MAG: lipoprotein [Stappiaceae bacterium]
MNLRTGVIAKTALVVMLSGLTILSSCGRKGSLDEPGAVTQSEPDGAAPAGGATEPEPDTPPKEDRPFILDAIL